MKSELTIKENKFLIELIKSYETKKKLTDIQQLIKTLSNKQQRSDAENKQLRILLSAEKLKLDNQLKNKQAKKVIADNKKQLAFETDATKKRYGEAFVEELKNFTNQPLDISLADFLRLLIENKHFTDKDRKWLSNFIANNSNSNANQ